MVIHDKVYDVTSFVDQHPGGEEVLLDFAGQHAKYASEAFDDVGHSEEALEILESLQIGSLTYDYKRLDFDTYEIRILVMDPISDETSSCDLRCQIQHESLISPTPYLALSYCWGPVEPRKEVILDGLKQGITPNLYDTLQEVRRHHYRSKRHNPIRLWVDALCINQNDNQERSEQVRTMRQIYSMAEEVLAYVGDVKICREDVCTTFREINISW